MPVAWRIVKSRHSSQAFTGKGPERFGGRWNSRGVRMIYASGTPALAALETLVHLNPPQLFSYSLFRLEFDDRLIEELRKLPRNWRSQPPPTSTQSIGDKWALEMRSAVLALPSVIVPQEVNYLLNPAHTDYPKIRIGKPKPFAFDPRLL